MLPVLAAAMSDQVVLQGAVAAAVAVLAGVAFLLTRAMVRQGSGLNLPLLKATCDACGTAWREMSFCLRCGAERNPKNRYAPGAIPPRRQRGA